MTDVSSFVMIVALVVLPALITIKIAKYILHVVYENQSIVLSLPLP